MKDKILRLGGLALALLVDVVRATIAVQRRRWGSTGGPTGGSTGGSSGSRSVCFWAVIRTLSRAAAQKTEGWNLVVALPLFHLRWR